MRPLKQPTVVKWTHRQTLDSQWAEFQDTPLKVRTRAKPGGERARSQTCGLRGETNAKDPVHRPLQIQHPAAQTLVCLPRNGKEGGRRCQLVVATRPPCYPGRHLRLWDQDQVWWEPAPRPPIMSLHPPDNPAGSSSSVPISRRQKLRLVGNSLEAQIQQDGRAGIHARIWLPPKGSLLANYKMEGTSRQEKGLLSGILISGCARC